MGDHGSRVARPVGLDTRLRTQSHLLPQNGSRPPTGLDPGRSYHLPENDNGRHAPRNRTALTTTHRPKRLSPQHILPPSACRGTEPSHLTGPKTQNSPSASSPSSRTNSPAPVASSSTTAAASPTPRNNSAATTPDHGRTNREARPSSDWSASHTLDRRHSPIRPSTDLPAASQATRGGAGGARTRDQPIASPRL